MSKESVIILGKYLPSSEFLTYMPCEVFFYISQSSICKFGDNFQVVLMSYLNHIKRGTLYV